jgi:choline dehydrogenase-like flavoprotein
MPVIDSSEFADNSGIPESLKCDICIIGSGPAGMTIARELSGTRFRVTLLESGGASRQAESDALNEIESVGWPREADQWDVRNRVLGGSSATWAGRCAPLDEIDMEYRDWVPYSGWPLQQSDLAPYVDRSAEHLGLGAGNGITDDRIWGLTGQPRTATGPHPDPDKLLPMFWQYGRDAVNSSDRTRFSTFTSDLGPNITLVTNATAVRINVTESAGAVESVEFAAADNRRWVLPASVAVLCAGGVENARLLLSSDNVVPHGLGNDKDLVGRFLMDHLRGPVGIYQLKEAGAVLEQFANFRARSPGGNIYQHGMRLSPTIQRKERLLNCSSWIHGYTEPGVRPGLRSMLANSGHLAYVAARHVIARRPIPRRITEIGLAAMCEQVPNPESRVTLSGRRDRLGMKISRIDWRVSEEEARTMRRMAELMIDQLSRMGLNLPKLERWVCEGEMFPQTFRDVAHPSGTTRMASDPAQGVVDPQCQVHGVDGLFVAGGSVFPTNGHANPTQTIVALAVRLADTLQSRVR